MSQEKREEQGMGRRYVGVDWGEFGHAVSIVDEARCEVSRFQVEASVAGLKRLAAGLEESGPIAGIAIEATSNLVTAFLLSNGFTVYAVNPKQSKSWRESNSVAGVKSDERDSLVLAVELARRHESLRPMRQPDRAVAELAGLCEQVRHLVDERTALVQRLKATLRRYYPAALDFFDDWTSPVAWRFLKRFARPECLARTRKETLCRFLKANRVGLSPRWQDRIARARNATDWPIPEDALVLEAAMLAIVAQLQALQPHLDRFDKLIAERTQKHWPAPLIESLPGVGKRLGPALTAMTLVVADEDDRMKAVRCLSGVAPVQAQSGKRRHTRMRRRCNKHWRNTLHLYARSSIQHCAWARAYYDLCRERGDKYATALRKLADKWLKIIHRMVATNETYDEDRYLAALRKQHSPICARLCGQTGG